MKFYIDTEYRQIAFGIVLRWKPFELNIALLFWVFYLKGKP